MKNLDFTDADLRELEAIKKRRETEELESEDSHFGFSWKGGSCKMFKGNVSKKILEFTCTSRRMGAMTERFRLVTLAEWDALMKRLEILENKKEKVK